MESLNVASNNRNSSRRSTAPEPQKFTPAPAPAPAPAQREEQKPFNYTNPAPAPAIVQQQRTSTPPNNGPVKGDDLDKLLSNLTSQMDHIEPDNPASRGQCATCKGAILGEMMQALGRCYHPEHFTCGNCHQPIGTKNFFEQNGLPHCQDCFQLMFCPKCGHCNGPVMDRCITAMGKKFHPEHFICAQCLKPFPGGNFFEKDGRPYCENDFFALFAPKCGACHEPVKGDTINALGQQWHPEHFVCTYCGKAFTGTFFEHANKPYCEAHYHQQTGSCCGGCGKPITGRCVNALDKKWHPEHFVCAFCMNPLAGGAFTEKNNKAYCKECHSKLFGN
jgi:paxillin